MDKKRKRFGLSPKNILSVLLFSCLQRVFPAKKTEQRKTCLDCCFFIFTEEVPLEAPKLRKGTEEYEAARKRAAEEAVVRLKKA